MLTWIFRTHATLAQPSPRGPSTWLPPTRTNCGSFVAKAIWLKAKKASETCSGTALGAGEHMTSFVFVLDHTAAISLANSCMVMLSQHSLMCRLNGINNPVLIPQCINVNMVNWLIMWYFKCLNYLPPSIIMNGEDNQFSMKISPTVHDKHYDRMKTKKTFHIIKNILFIMCWVLDFLHWCGWKIIGTVVGTPGHRLESRGDVGMVVVVFLITGDKYNTRKH